MRLLAMMMGALLVGACGDDGGTEADTADTQQAETTPDTSAETTAETSETTPAPVTWDDVYPIFVASCTPCHGGATPSSGPSGGHSIASADKAVAYQASQRDATHSKCSGKKIGECALIRIQDGSMPASGDCQDPKTAKCPDQDAQALIQQWVNDGMLEQ
jgi:hypothetical protein